MTWVDTVKEIEQKVAAILREHHITEGPVRVEDIAKSRGLRVMPYAFEDDISGVLVIDPTGATIGYNQNESRVRRRFTIAHEFGHYELHKERSTIFMDKGFNAMFRSKQSRENEQIQSMEAEANAFAASILMPASLVKRVIATYEFDLSSEESIKPLAKMFDVSSPAMYYRIMNLGLAAPFY